MMTLELQDLTGRIDAVVFPNVYRKYRDKLVDGSRVLLSGDLSYSDVEKPKLIVNEVSDLKQRETLYIKTDSEKNSNEINMARGFIQSNPGDGEVVFYFSDKDAIGTFKDASALYLNSKNIDFLEKLFGKENIKRNGDQWRLQF